MRKGLKIFGQIENTFYEVGQIKEGLKEYFPTTYQEVFNMLNYFAESFGLQCVE